MNAVYFHLGQWWFLVRKDLQREYRSRAAWPSMALLGLLMLMAIEMQLDLPAALSRQVAGGMLWLAIFFGGAVPIERSFSSEQADGCWDALRMYPVEGATLYLAKFAFNFISLAILSCVLLPMYVVLTDAPLLKQWPATSLLAMLTCASHAGWSDRQLATFAGQPGRAAAAAVGLACVAGRVRRHGIAATRRHGRYVWSLASVVGRVFANQPDCRSLAVRLRSRTLI